MQPARAAGKAVFTVIDLFAPRVPGARILIYHQVGAGLGRQMEVSREDFTAQMGWLAANRLVVDLDTALRSSQSPGSERRVVLSFDDGYRDLYTTAFPVLKEHGFPFVLYLATESIESRRPLGPAAGAEPLSWDDVGIMAESGLMTVGAHTHRHLDLRDATREQVVDEISTSDRLIQSRLGIVPDHFAYPWGYWSELADPEIRGRYRSAVIGATPHPAFPPDPHRLHRFPVQLSDGFFFFKRRLRGNFRVEELIRRRLAGYHGP